MNMERLIELVEKNKILYDSEHPEYKNNSKRNEIWDEIGLELEESGNEIKKKWKNLRDRFGKSLKPSSRHAGKPWIWANKMEWLRPYMCSTYNSEEREEGEPEPEAEALSLVLTDESINGFNPRATSSIEDIHQISKSQGSDDIDMWFLAHAN
ncbi:transcription factor Adf-1-like [Drosophila nasuta]|uniref:transcription factor Adf-1-like n=1 Tax=Drosophila nasuta TaxID=42062 RepID=UPI00295E81A3|nr:transcription factor Adf-1-like [Drosophila nasuta]